MEGKELLALTSGAIKNPHCTNHLQYFLPFSCKIQASLKPGVVGQLRKSHHTHLIVTGERFDVTVAVCHKDYPEHLCIKAFLGTSENVDSARAPLKTFGLY